jgi:hypothetical protein
MTGHKRLPGDELIKEALHRELHSIEAPSADAVWRSIEARLAESEPSPSLSHPAAPGQRAPGTATAAQRSRGRFAWSRFAAVAAVLLLACLGGIGIYKGFDFPGGDGAGLLMESAADSAAESAADTAGEAGDAFVQSDAEAERSLFGAPRAEICTLPGEDCFPPASEAGFTLAETKSLETKRGTRAIAAVYTRGPDSLLWLQMDRDAAGGDFTGTLAEMLSTTVELTGSDGSRTRLEMGGRPALSWESDGSRLLIWDLSGTLTETGLRSLLD